ncbi:ATP-binding protein [Geodermatophilus pulveris]|uniref:ATP-binding protein n=1 Tax=Geodermatophilus pulveris TaxID=1564159 RepID=UPI00117AC8BB|nr:ATP-binding protein [Geodermatophilus pulveris]
MSQQVHSSLPRLVALPTTIPELLEWPELEHAAGRALKELPARERQWLTIATLHSSALYENKNSYPNISPVCLTLLERVGAATIEVELRRAIAKAAPNFDLKRTHEQVRRINPTVRELATLALGIRGRAGLGRGEAAQAAGMVARGLKVRAFENVALQVVGWWSLALSGAGLRTFVEALYAQAASSLGAAIEDVRLRFQQHTAGLAPAFDITSSGPDHDLVFVVTVTTRDGRTGKAEARSKKEAQRLACHDYLSRHAPHILADTGVPVKGPRQIARRPEYPVTDERYVTLADRFHCRNSEPFTRALTHRSWTYENVVGGDVERHSNALLASLGSSVLTATAMRHRAAILLSQTTDPDPEVAVALTIPDAALRSLFEDLGLRRLARVGAGLRGQPLTDEIVASMVRATLAASHLQWPDHATFETKLPDEVSRFLVRKASISLLSPITRLEQLAAELHFELDEKDKREGPDHNTTFRVRMNVRGLAQPIAVEGAGASRTAARQAAAADFLASADVLTDRSADVPDASIARLLLVRQLEVLPASRARWPRWQRLGRLGAHMLAREDFESFGRWAARVLEVTGSRWRPDPAVEASLTDYFGQVLQAPHARALFTATLTEVTDWIAEAGRSDELPTSFDEPMRRLVPLSAAQSVWLSSGEDQAVRQIIDDWILLNRRRLNAECDVALDGAVVDARTTSALLKALQDCADHVSRLDQPHVSVRGRTTADGATVVVGCVGSVLSALRSSLMMRLLGESSRRLVVDAPDAHSIELRVKNSLRSSNADWLTAAAYGEPAADDYDAELARLIHDLKNEVTGAKVASERNAGTRTERLEAQLASSRHVDAAAALASRLRDADMLYAAADLVGSTDVAAFMQGYVSDLMRQLPTHIRVVPPTLVPAVAAVDQRALRAVLDNLVKNAEQAMSAGGEITFEYTASPADDVLLIDIADTGDGIPVAVIEALAAGKPVSSSKREGSGLGLLGVRRILRRAGGDLESVPRARGTGWLITLPLATATELTEAA